MTLIHTKEQFVQALREHPEWREAVRLEILGEELMRLPTEFQAFIVRQEAFNDEMRQFRDAVLQRFSNMDRRLERMEHDGSWLKGFGTEYQADRYAMAMCALADCDLVRVLSNEEKLDIARNLTGPDITRASRGSFATADMIIEAADDHGETVFLTVEISYTAAPRDQRRAIRNAEWLSRHTGRPVIPLVAGIRYDRDLQTFIDSGQMLWFDMENP